MEMRPPTKTVHFNTLPTIRHLLLTRASIIECWLNLTDKGQTYFSYELR